MFIAYEKVKEIDALAEKLQAAEEALKRADACVDSLTGILDSDTKNRNLARVRVTEYINKVEKIEDPVMTDAKKIETLREALTAITNIAGNLSDDRITDKTGPNDAAQRGLMVVQARNIAHTALNEMTNTESDG